REIRTPSSAIAPKRYLPETVGTTLPVQRAEKLSAGTPVPGLNIPQSKLTVSSTRFKTGVPSRLLFATYSAFIPPGIADAGTGTAETSVSVVPIAYKTFV